MRRRAPKKIFEGTDLDERFYDYLAGLPDDRQVIIVENIDPPAAIKAKAQVEIFSGNPHTGRYGVFPPESQGKLLGIVASSYEKGILKYSSFGTFYCRSGSPPAAHSYPVSAILLLYGGNSRYQATGSLTKRARLASQYCLSVKQDSGSLMARHCQIWAHRSHTDTRKTESPQQQDGGWNVSRFHTDAGAAPLSGLLVTGAQKWLLRFESMSRSLLRVADQHHVGFPMTANDGELFSVGGVVKVADEFRLEVCELLPGSTIQMLQP